MNASTFIPAMVVLLDSDETLSTLKVQILRTVSLIVQGNRRIIENLSRSVTQDECLIKTLVNLVGDTEHPKECGWACYILRLMSTAGEDFMHRLKGMPVAVCDKGIQYGEDMVAQYKYMI